MLIAHRFFGRQTRSQSVRSLPALPSAFKALLRARRTFCLSSPEFV
jgi:hypothetical protein